MITIEKSFVRGPADGVGKLVDCLLIKGVTRDLGAGPVSADVERQVVVLADPDVDDMIVRHEGARILQALPTVLTPLVIGPCKLAYLYLVNTSPSDLIPVTVQDQTGTPLVLLPAYGMPPQSPLMLDFKRPLVNGLSWLAGDAGVNGYAVVYQ